MSPYESDAQIAHLQDKQLVDFVISEDSDLLAYGCSKVSEEKCKIKRISFFLPQCTFYLVCFILSTVPCEHFVSHINKGKVNSFFFPHFLTNYIVLEDNSYKDRVCAYFVFKAMFAAAVTRSLSKGKSHKEA